MIYEYALDPSSITDWQDVRYIVENFGIEHGRVISRFPRKWKKMVYEACRNCQPVKLKTIEDKLSTIDRKLLSFRREYDNDKTWLINAEEQDCINPFRAIISNENPKDNARVLIVNDIDNKNLLWEVNREITVIREAEELANCASILLSKSSQIIFVDPHFGPDLERFLNTFSKFLNWCFCNNNPIRIELHVKKHNDGKDPYWKRINENWNNIWKDNLASLIPKDNKVKIIRWRKKRNGENLHPRYVLTNLGGIRYEAGLDEGREGETTDVSLLEDSFHRKRWKNYQKDTAAFNLVDELEIIGCKL